MLKILADRTFRHLFLAQVIALIGSGLATVASGSSPSISRAPTPARCWARRWP